MSVKFYIICSDKNGRRAQLSGEAEWYPLEEKDSDQMDGFLIDGIYEIATSSKFADQQMVIMDEESTKIAKHSHQYVAIHRKPS